MPSVKKFEALLQSKVPSTPKTGMTDRSHLPRQQPIPAARFTPQQAAEAPGVPSVKKFEALLQSKVPSTPKTGKDSSQPPPPPATNSSVHPPPQQAAEAPGVPSVKKFEALLQSKVPSTPKTGKRQIATTPCRHQFQRLKTCIVTPPPTRAFPRPGSPHSKQQEPPECPQSRNPKLCFNPKYRPHPKREKTVRSPRPATKARFTPQQAEDARGPPPVKNREPNFQTKVPPDSQTGKQLHTRASQSAPDQSIPTRPRAKGKRDRSHTLRSPTKLQTLFPKFGLPHTSSCPAKKYPISNCAVSSGSTRESRSPRSTPHTSSGSSPPPDRRIRRAHQLPQIGNRVLLLQHQRHNRPDDMNAVSERNNGRSR